MRQQSSNQTTRRIRGIDTACLELWTRVYYVINVVPLTLLFSIFAVREPNCICLSS